MWIHLAIRATFNLRSWALLSKIMDQQLVITEKLDWRASCAVWLRVWVRNLWGCAPTENATPMLIYHRINLDEAQACSASSLFPAQHFHLNAIFGDIGKLITVLVKSLVSLINRHNKAATYKWKDSIVQQLVVLVIGILDIIMTERNVKNTKVVVQVKTGGMTNFDLKCDLVWL